MQSFLMAQTANRSISTDDSNRHKANFMKPYSPGLAPGAKDSFPEAQTENP